MNLIKLNNKGIMKLNSVHHMDCLDGMKFIADKSVDMILCDLPYGTTNCKWDVIIPFEPLWKQYERIIKDNGAIVLTASQPFTSVLVMSNLNLFKYEWIWKKSQGTGFLNAKKQPLRSHESILVFYKKQPAYNPQFTEARKLTTSKIDTKPKDSMIYRKLAQLSTWKETGRRYPISVQAVQHDNIRYNSSAIKKIAHPTQKPVALFEYLIKTYTNEGETVLDNTAGSMTTGIACMNTGRNFILFEKEEEYFKRGVNRLYQRAIELGLLDIAEALPFCEKVLDDFDYKNSQR